MEWLNEPNFLEWDFHNMHCLIIRNDLGVLCGYVGVNKEHELYQTNYCNFRVHGGISFTGNDVAGMKGDLFYFGFDCARARDLIPKFETFNINFIDDGGFKTYRNIEYVKEHVKNLAYQLHYRTYIIDELL